MDYISFDLAAGLLSAGMGKEAMEPGTEAKSACRRGYHSPEILQIALLGYAATSYPAIAQRPVSKTNQLSAGTCRNTETRSVGANLHE